MTLFSKLFHKSNSKPRYFNDLTKGSSVIVRDNASPDNPKVRVGFIKKVRGDKMKVYIPSYGRNFIAHHSGVNWTINDE